MVVPCCTGELISQSVTLFIIQTIEWIRSLWLLLWSLFLFSDSITAHKLTSLTYVIAAVLGIFLNDNASLFMVPKYSYFRFSNEGHCYLKVSPVCQVYIVLAEETFVKFTLKPSDLPPHCPRAGLVLLGRRMSVRRCKYPSVWAGDPYCLPEGCGESGFFLSTLLWDSVLFLIKDIVEQWLM